MAGLRLLAGLLPVLVVTSAAAESFQKGPYLQNVDGHAVTIMWQSSRSLAGRVVVQGPDGSERTAESPARGVHEVRVAGLEPGRRYRYRVESGGEKAEGEFATAPGADDPFTFVVFGDTRSQSDPHRTLTERIRREVPDFILLTGDMVDDGAKEAEWQTFFEIERELLRENVVFPAVGNHDRQGRGRTADAYRRYFSVPADTPDPERYYAFTYGNARFFILDSNEHSFALTDQTAWLEKVLKETAANPRIDHRFVVMHHPVYSSSLHGGHTELREMWVPLFERYGVTAVFSGHDHTYERAAGNAVRYFVSGGGGAPLYPKDPRASAADRKASRYFERTHNFLRVHVVGPRVEVTAMREDGSLIESVAWGQLEAPRVAAAPGPVIAPVGGGVARSVAPVASAVRSPARACSVAPGGRGEGAWLLLVGLGLMLRRARAGRRAAAR